LSVAPIRGEEALYEKTVRLHVIARSDSETDQAEKLQVRDAVLAALATPLSAADDTDSAKALLADLLPEIEAAAKTVTDAAVTVSLGTERYPTRHYEGFSLPAGEYTSLRVVLDEGEGQNWWCVLFPRLCTAAASQNEFYEDFIAAGFTPEQYRLIREESGRKYKIRFKILEILAAFLGE
jgi:stage II sporulation protein R